MASKLAFLLQQLLVFIAIKQILCIASTQSPTTTTNPQGGITAKLIRRAQYLADEFDESTPTQKIVEEARRSMLRVQSLVSKRQLAGTTSSSSSSGPAPGSADWETPLSDAAAAEYLMEIILGTPPQKFVAIADTGSDLTWLQCAPCMSGCSTAAIFQPTESSTYAGLSCSSTTCLFLNESGSDCPISNAVSATGCAYGYKYGDGSITTGTLAKDTITLQKVTGGNQTVPDYWFGCSTNAASNSSLLDSTDGLVGLGRGNISFPVQLGKYFGNTFGYCLVNRSLGLDVAESPLFFGSDAVPAATLEYTPILNNRFISTFYYVGCTGIGLNGATIKTIPATAFAITVDGNGGTIFDSGTTYTTLSLKIFTPLSAAIQAQSTAYSPVLDNNYGFDLCYNASWTDWARDYGKATPIISFQFTNTTGFTLPVDNAWVQLDSLTVCLAIMSSSSDLNIFGNVQQVGFHVLYDLENQQIGFVEADCKPSYAPQSSSQSYSNSTSHRNVASWSTCLVSGILSLLFLLASIQ